MFWFILSCLCTSFFLLVSFESRCAWLVLTDLISQFTRNYHLVFLLIYQVSILTCVAAFVNNVYCCRDFAFHQQPIQSMHIRHCHHFCWTPQPCYMSINLSCVLSMNLTRAIRIILQATSRLTSCDDCYIIFILQTLIFSRKLWSWDTHKISLYSSIHFYCILLTNRNNYYTSIPNPDKLLLYLTCIFNLYTSFLRYNLLVHGLLTISVKRNC